MNEESLKEIKEIIICLSSLTVRLRALEEKTDCILHAICKNDDEKTHEAIRKFLISNFRNRQYK